MRLYYITCKNYIILVLYKATKACKAQCFRSKYRKFAVAKAHLPSSQAYWKYNSQKLLCNASFPVIKSRAGQEYLSFLPFDSQ